MAGVKGWFLMAVDTGADWCGKGLIGVAVDAVNGQVGAVEGKNVVVVKLSHAIKPVMTGETVIAKQLGVFKHK